jgi:hypothetical protein|tara:strand:+ start:153 stop:1019 length:867 start_codon:yes stop_codon:yes gene_type:complete
MSKKTLVCIHIMPNEIEMFQTFMIQYRKALMYCKDYEVYIKATLNLNPKLTDWDNSELKQDYFIKIFNEQFQYKEIHQLNEIILDDSMWGTTQQKRESIKINYFDQFLFVDTDIIIHEHQLMYQLRAAEPLNGKYIVSPAIPKWWDNSWDVLVDSSMRDTEFNTKETLESVHQQTPNKLVMHLIPTIKFGCGMHTLYSKEFWQFIGIPDSFGGYGPEDTFGMMASIGAIKKGYDIKQYVLDGIYISEDYFNREPTIKNKIVKADMKTDFYKEAQSHLSTELHSFIARI